MRHSCTTLKMAISRLLDTRVQPTCHFQIDFDITPPLTHPGTISADSSPISSSRGGCSKRGKCAQFGYEIRFWQSRYYSANPSAKLGHPAMQLPASNAARFIERQSKRLPLCAVHADRRAMRLLSSSCTRMRRAERSHELRFVNSRVSACSNICPDSSV